MADLGLLNCEKSSKLDHYIVLKDVERIFCSRVIARLDRAIQKSIRHTFSLDHPVKPDDDTKTNRMMTQGSTSSGCRSFIIIVVADLGLLNCKKSSKLDHYIVLKDVERIFL